MEVTDATDGLVTWYIEDGWTLLDSETTTTTTEDEEGNQTTTTTTTYIYYQLLEYDADAGDPNTDTLHVLKGDTVYYSATLTNEDLADAEDISLTFQAYIIQADPFVDAENAWKVLSAQMENEDGNVTYPAGYTVDLTTGYVYETVAAAISAANDGDVIYLLADSTVTVSDLTTSKDLMFDLNGNTLSTETSDYSIGISGDVTISNGTLNLTNGSGSTASIALAEGSSLTLDSLTVNISDTDDAGAGSIVVSSGVNNATLTVKDSTINSADYYAISTNATNTTSGGNVVINIENSTITVTETHDSNSDSAAVLFNIPGTLNITGSNITGQRQGVIVRCGTANISDSSITTTGAFTGTMDGTEDKWGSGNEVPMAALVAGNVSGASSYPYDATVNLSNVTLTGTDTVPAIYAGSSAYNTTVTGASGSDTIMAYNNGNAAITVNGTAVANTTTITTVGALTSVTDTED